MDAFDLRMPHTTNQLETPIHFVSGLKNNSTLRPAALGCCVYKSDTNLMGALQLLHVYK